MSEEYLAEGLIHAHVLDGNGGARALTVSEVASWTAADGVLWLHFDFTKDGTYHWLAEQSGIPDVAVDGLTVNQTRPRAVAQANGLLVALRGVNMNPGDDPEDMVSIRAWIDKDRIITSRRRRLLAIQDMLAALEKGEGPSSSSNFLADLIDRLADRIGNFVDEIEDRLLQIEDKLSDDSPQGQRRSLGVARRQIANVRRFVAPQRDALERLYRNPGDWFPDSEIQQIREEADRITRYVEDLDLARERAIVLQEEYLSVMAQEQNNRMYVLSIVAAIFLPLTFVTGLLGMNVGGLPGTNSELGFSVSVATMIICAILVAVILRWKRWM